MIKRDKESRSFRDGELSPFANRFRANLKEEATRACFVSNFYERSSKGSLALRRNSHVFAVVVRFQRLSKLFVEMVSESLEFILLCGYFRSLIFRHVNFYHLAGG